MKRVGLIASMLALLALSSAQAQLPTYLGLPSSGVAPPSCSSGSLMDGTFDLTNTCNDIYFIGALK